LKLAEKVFDVESTLEGERIAMGIDPGSMAKIRLILTRLYADPELAIIREYSTNALDSHIEAGQARPIEVTTPTNLMPFFKVRDFGIGLSSDDIRYIYSQYGNSTKTESNDVVGMLGLGSKSALAYTDQFTVRGTKNGMTTHVIVSSTQDGGADMTIVDEYASDEENGVEVIIPAKVGNKLDHKAAMFFRFWTPGTVLVNGEEPKTLNGTWITEDLLLTKEVEQSFLVMGNVAYPMSDNQRWNDPKIVAFTPIGTVDFAPSREALELTNRTKAAVEGIQLRVKAETQAAFLRDVAASSDHVSAVKKMHEVVRMGLEAKAVVLFMGEPVPQVWETAANAQPMTMVNYKKPRYNKGWSHEPRITTQYSVIWLEGYDGADFTPTKRKKLEVWWDENKGERSNPDQFLLVNRVPRKLRKWIDPTTIEKWADVAAIKLARKTTVRADGRPTGSYKGYSVGIYSDAILAGDIDTSKPLFFYNSTWTSARDQRNVMEKLKPNATIIALPSNRVTKFKRDFPMALELTAAVKTTAEDWFKGLSKADKLALKTRLSRDTSALKNLDPERVNDPDLQDQIKSATMDKAELFKKYELFSAYVSLAEVKIENAMEKYPLYDEYRVSRSEYREHLYLYINAAYAAAQEEANVAV
jgi:hypothetical protein